MARYITGINVSVPRQSQAAWAITQFSDGYSAVRNDEIYRNASGYYQRISDDVYVNMSNSDYTVRLKNGIVKNPTTTKFVETDARHWQFLYAHPGDGLSDSIRYSTNVENTTVNSYVQSQGNFSWSGFSYSRENNTVPSFVGIRPSLEWAVRNYIPSTENAITGIRSSGQTSFSQTNPAEVLLFRQQPISEDEAGVIESKVPLDRATWDVFSEPNEFVPSQGLTIEFIYAEDNTLDYNPDNPAFSGEIAYISGKPPETTANGSPHEWPRNTGTFWDFTGAQRTGILNANQVGAYASIPPMYFLGFDMYKGVIVTYIPDIGYRVTDKPVRAKAVVPDLAGGADLNVRANMSNSLTTLDKAFRVPLAVQEQATNEGWTPEGYPYIDAPVPFTATSTSGRVYSAIDNSPEIYSTYDPNSNTIFGYSAYEEGLDGNLPKSLIYENANVLENVINVLVPEDDSPAVVQFRNDMYCRFPDVLDFKTQVFSRDTTIPRENLSGLLDNNYNRGVLWYNIDQDESKIGERETPLPSAPNTTGIIGIKNYNNRALPSREIEIIVDPGDRMHGYGTAVIGDGLTRGIWNQLLERYDASRGENQGRTHAGAGHPNKDLTNAADDPHAPLVLELRDTRDSPGAIVGPQCWDTPNASNAYTDDTKPASNSIPAHEYTSRYTGYYYRKSNDNGQPAWFKKYDLGNDGNSNRSTGQKRAGNIGKPTPPHGFNHPVPATEDIRIEFDSPSGYFELRDYDLTGQSPADSPKIYSTSDSRYNAAYTPIFRCRGYQNPKVSKTFRDIGGKAKPAFGPNGTNQEAFSYGVPKTFSWDRTSQAAKFSSVNGTISNVSTFKTNATNPTIKSSTSRNCTFTFEVKNGLVYDITLNAIGSNVNLFNGIKFFVGEKIRINDGVLNGFEFYVRDIRNGNDSKKGNQYKEGWEAVMHNSPGNIPGASSNSPVNVFPFGNPPEVTSLYEKNQNNIFYCENEYNYRTGNFSYSESYGRGGGHEYPISVAIWQASSLKNGVMTSNRAGYSMVDDPLINLDSPSSGRSKLIIANDTATGSGSHKPYGNIAIPESDEPVDPNGHNFQTVPVDYGAADLVALHDHIGGIKGINNHKKIMMFDGVTEYDVHSTEEKASYNRHLGGTVHYGMGGNYYNGVPWVPKGDCEVLKFGRSAVGNGNPVLTVNMGFPEHPNYGLYGYDPTDSIGAIGGSRAAYCNIDLVDDWHNGLDIFKKDEYGTAIGYKYDLRIVFGVVPKWSTIEFYEAYQGWNNHSWQDFYLHLYVEALSKSTGEVIDYAGDLHVLGTDIAYDPGFLKLSPSMNSLYRPGSGAVADLDQFVTRVATPVTYEPNRIIVAGGVNPAPSNHFGGSIPAYFKGLKIYKGGAVYHNYDFVPKQAEYDYTLSRNKLSVGEISPDDEITITLKSIEGNVGEEVRWVLEPDRLSDQISLDDFVGLDSFEGTFIINEFGEDFVTFKLNRDRKTEGSEQARIRLVRSPEVFTTFLILDTSRFVTYTLESDPITNNTISLDSPELINYKTSQLRLSNFGSDQRAYEVNRPAGNLILGSVIWPMFYQRDFVKGTNVNGLYTKINERFFSSGEYELIKPFNEGFSTLNEIKLSNWGSATCLPEDFLNIGGTFQTLTGDEQETATRFGRMIRGLTYLSDTAGIIGEQSVIINPLTQSTDETAPTQYSSSLQETIYEGTFGKTYSKSISHFMLDQFYTDERIQTRESWGLKAQISSVYQIFKWSYGIWKSPSGFNVKLARDRYDRYVLELPTDGTKIKVNQIEYDETNERVYRRINSRTFRGQPTRTEAFAWFKRPFTEAEYIKFLDEEHYLHTMGQFWQIELVDNRWELCFYDKIQYEITTAESDPNADIPLSARKFTALESKASIVNQMPYDVTSPDNVYSTFEGEVAWPVPLEARTNTTTVNGKQVQEEYNKIFTGGLDLNDPLIGARRIVVYRDILETSQTADPSNVSWKYTLSVEGAGIIDDLLPKTYTLADGTTQTSNATGNVFAKDYGLNRIGSVSSVDIVVNYDRDRWILRRNVFPFDILFEDIQDISDDTNIENVVFQPAQKSRRIDLTSAIDLNLQNLNTEISNLFPDNYFADFGLEYLVETTLKDIDDVTMVRPLLPKTASDAGGSLHRLFSGYSSLKNTKYYTPYIKSKVMAEFISREILHWDTGTYDDEVILTYGEPLEYEERATYRGQPHQLIVKNTEVQAKVQDNINLAVGILEEKRSISYDQVPIIYEDKSQSPNSITIKLTTEGFEQGAKVGFKLTAYADGSPMVKSPFVRAMNNDFLIDAPKEPFGTSVVLKSFASNSPTIDLSGINGKYIMQNASPAELYFKAVAADDFSFTGNTLDKLELFSIEQDSPEIGLSAAASPSVLGDSPNDDSPAIKFNPYRFKIRRRQWTNLNLSSREIKEDPTRNVFSMRGFAGSGYRGVAPYVDIKVGSDDNNWIDPAIQSLYPNFPTDEPEWWKKLSDNLSPAHAGFYFTNKQNQTPSGGLLSFARAPFAANSIAEGAIRFTWNEGHPIGLFGIRQLDGGTDANEFAGTYRYDKVNDVWYNVANPGAGTGVYPTATNNKGFFKFVELINIVGYWSNQGGAWQWGETITDVEVNDAPVEGRGQSIYKNLEGKISSLQKVTVDGLTRTPRIYRNIGEIAVTADDRYRARSGSLLTKEQGFWFKGTINEQEWRPAHESQTAFTFDPPGALRLDVATPPNSLIKLDAHTLRLQGQVIENPLNTNIFMYSPRQVRSMQILETSNNRTRIRLHYGTWGYENVSEEFKNLKRGDSVRFYYMQGLCNFERDEVSIMGKKITVNPTYNWRGTRTGETRTEINSEIQKMYRAGTIYTPACTIAAPATDIGTESDGRTPTGGTISLYANNYNYEPVFNFIYADRARGDIPTWIASSTWNKRTQQGLVKKFISGDMFSRGYNYRTTLSTGATRFDSISRDTYIDYYKVWPAFDEGEMMQLNQFNDNLYEVININNEEKYIDVYAPAQEAVGDEQELVRMWKDNYTSNSNFYSVGQIQETYESTDSLNAFQPNWMNGPAGFGETDAYGKVWHTIESRKSYYAHNGFFIYKAGEDADTNMPAQTGTWQFDGVHPKVASGTFEFNNTLNQPTTTSNELHVYGEPRGEEYKSNGQLNMEQ